MKKYSLSLILFVFIVSSCAVPLWGNKEDVNTPNENFATKAKVEINNLVVIPFSSKSDNLEGELRPAILTKEKILTMAFYNDLVPKVNGVDFILLDSAAKEYENIVNTKPELPYNQVALKIAEKFNTDAVITGNISRFIKREGSELGVESPASVSFTVEVLDTKSGVVIWRDTYSETQQPLLGNIYDLDKFIERGGKWVTAQELAREGVSDVVDKLANFLNQN